MQEVILGRLDKISPVARQVLEAAAVLAPDLDQPLLQETARRADFELADALDELVRRQMLTEGEPPRLRHDLLTQVTYQNLSPWRRRLLHHRAAGALAELHPGEVDEAAQVARHYDAAGEYKRAVDSFLLAATAARERYAQDEAIGYLERALELSKELLLSPQRLAKIYARLGESLVARGEFEAARQAYQNCLTHMPTEEIIQRAEVQRKLAMTFLSQRRLGEAETAFEDALATLGPGPGGKSAAWQVAWLDIQLARLELLYFQYKLEQLDEILQRIEPLLEEIGTPKHYDTFYGGQSRLLAQQERFSLAKKSIRIAEKMLRAAQETDEPATLAYAKFGLGFSLLWSGDLEVAAGSMEDSLAMAEEFGVAMTQCLSLAYLGYCYRLQSDMARVRTIARRSLENAQQLDIPAYVGAAQAHLAWVDWRENKLVAAERGARKALALWAEYMHPFQWNAHLVLCAIHLERGQLAAAVESARAMLHSNQARLPDDVTAALECVIGGWDSGEQADA